MDKHDQNIDNVLAMSEFRTETGYSAVAQVEAYWDGLRGARLMPKRSEIDPRGIESALENTFVLERIAPGMARLRIAGSHLSDLMGMEVRGMPLTSFVTPSARRQVGDALEEVFQRPAVCELRLSAEACAGKPPMEARLLLLPLKSDLGDVSRILGCLVGQGEIGHTPRRFEVVGAKMRPITAAGQSTETEKEIPALLSAEPRADFGEAEPTLRKSRPNKGVPYLRLVKSDEG